MFLRVLVSDSLDSYMVSLVYMACISTVVLGIEIKVFQEGLAPYVRDRIYPLLVSLYFSLMGY